MKSTPHTSLLLKKFTFQRTWKMYEKCVLVCTFFSSLILSDHEADQWISESKRKFKRQMKKKASKLEATLVWKTDPACDPLTGVKCRATNVAKNIDVFHFTVYCIALQCTSCANYTKKFVRRILSVVQSWMNNLNEGRFRQRAGSQGVWWGGVGARLMADCQVQRSAKTHIC